MNIALKEWSAVIRALDLGRQIFLLRRGGLAEAGRGFQATHPEFIFFPTFEHQHARFLKPEYAGCLRAPDTAEDQVAITHLAQITDVFRAPAMPEMDALADLHVWNPEFIRQRYAYRPDLPLHLVVVRAFRLERPHIIPLRAIYAGCKSWVNLTEEIPTGTAQPVVEEPVFESLRGELATRLASAQRV